MLKPFLLLLSSCIINSTFGTSLNKTSQESRFNAPGEITDSISANLPVKAKKKKKMRFQQPKNDINQIIIYGQSLSTGQQTAPSLSVKNYAGNLMLGNQVWSNFSNNIDTPSLVFNPLFARPTIYSKNTNEQVLADVSIDANNQINCETPAEGFANAVKYNFDKDFPELSNRKFAATSTGEGGRSIEILSKNSPNKDGKLYSYTVKTMTRSKEASARMGKSINCSALLWMQGEYNYTQASKQGWSPASPATKDKNVYKNYLSKLVSDLTCDVKTAYEQTDAPVFITYQCGAQFTKDFDVPIGMAQLELANTDPRVVLAGPVYPVSDRGGHLCPNGSRWYGEMMAKVYYKTIIRGEKWIPLQPKTITKGKKSIDIDFYVPEPPLKFDTLTLKQVKNFGFTVKENGAEKKIFSVSLISATKIRLTMDTNFKDESVEVNYAGPATVGNGNLCDSDNFKSFATYQNLNAEGATLAEKNRFKPKYEPRDKNGNIIYGQAYPLQNFCCVFYYKIAAHKYRIKF